MPYKKGGAAEQRGKLRRAAKRRIKRFEKEVRNARNEKEKYFYEQQIKTLERQIESTYQINPRTHKRTGATDEELRMAQRNLSRTVVNTRYGSAEQERRNFITEQEINAASRDSGMGEFTEAEVKVFYRATQEAWEGAPSGVNRNRLILDYYGETDLRDFMRRILDYNREALDEVYESGEIPDEDGLEKDNEDGREGSPEYIAFVNQVNLETWNKIRSGTDMTG